MKRKKKHIEWVKRNEAFQYFTLVRSKHLPAVKDDPFYDCINVRIFTLFFVISSFFFSFIYLVCTLSWFTTSEISCECDRINTIHYGILPYFGTKHHRVFTTSSSSLLFYVKDDDKCQRMHSNVWCAVGLCSPHTNQRFNICKCKSSFHCTSSYT